MTSPEQKAALSSTRAARSTIPKDPGGRTNQGVTQRTYDAWRRSQGLPTRDVYLMADAERDAIYKGEYWTPVRGDDLPVGLDFCVFDAAVNSGVGQAGVWLQNALGDHYAGTVDGVIGAKTMQAVADYGDVGQPDRSLLLAPPGDAAASQDVARVRQRAGMRVSPTSRRRRAPGTTARRRRKRSTSPVSAGIGRRPSGGNIKPPAVSQIAAHITTAATGAGAIASQTAQQITALQDTFAWLKWAFGGLTLGGRGRRDRRQDRRRRQGSRREGHGDRHRRHRRRRQVAGAARRQDGRSRADVCNDARPGGSGGSGERACGCPGSLRC